MSDGIDDKNYFKILQESKKKREEEIKKLLEEE